MRVRKLGLPLRIPVFVCAALGLACGCAFDDTLRAYLDSRFWLPFSKEVWHFEKKNIDRISMPFAGMTAVAGKTPLARLRAAYQQVSPEPIVRSALSAARADQSLTQREREEVDLLDAKIDMRGGEGESDDASGALLGRAETKLQLFLRSAHTPEFLSEAGGWLAHIHYLFGEQASAGKFYLDELNRSGSNLSRETLMNSLRMTYGYDGGQQLIDDLDQYFDTPEHAAFAIQLVTNPHWKKYGVETEQPGEAQTYSRIKGLLQTHRTLLDSDSGADTLASLGMRTALRMGDPQGAMKIARMVPAKAAIRRDPDFNWMLASVYFLSHDFAGAEAPLLKLFHCQHCPADSRAAAAYGLCGVYSKTGNIVEQLRFALWLHSTYTARQNEGGYPAELEDHTVYWAETGWDLNLLLEIQAPDDALRAFLDGYPGMADVRLVRYALAVRFARENRYEEAARIYESIHATARALRMRQLGMLYQEANRADIAPEEQQRSRYRLAEFIMLHSERIYFNDQLWAHMQRYALIASQDSRLTRREREIQIAQERRLKDDQEERWRAFLILRDVVEDSGRTETGRDAARLAIRCLRSISDRFDRAEEISREDARLSKWLRG